MGVSTEVNILPVPIQRELPIWLTGQSDDTFSNAGKLGFNVLTANFALHHNLKGFVRKLKLYRDTIRAHHGRRGHISLMAHAFVGDSGDAIKKIAQPAMAEYIKVNIEMQKDHSAGTRDEQGALRKTSWVNPTISALCEKDTQAIIDAQVHNNLRSPLSFIGTFEECAKQAQRLSEIGVDEIACLIDFGVGFDDTMASLHRLSALLA
jgi:alkanesulfonate monooxygenase SsuD/methylene tetrahydromethanopterin reductase-like flavin-dependent oxidoreductase (luciferase family)